MRPSRRILVAIVVLLAAAAVAANEPPIAVDDAYSTEIGAAISVDAPGVLENDSDPENDPLTAVLIEGPLPGSEFQLFADGGFEYKPPTGFGGVDSFTYAADDGFGQGNVATVEIEVSGVSGRQPFTDQVAFLETLAQLGLQPLRERFEDDAAWGEVRTTTTGGEHTAPSVTNKGITWTSNNPTSEVTTGPGPARTGLWGFFTLPHGNFQTGTDCHLPNACTDGWTLTGQQTLIGVGGWVETNTFGAKLQLVIDGDAGQPVDFGNVPLDYQHQFYGVIDPAGFQAVEFRETEGKAEDQKLIFGDDFLFAFSVASDLSLTVTGTCPGQVTLSVSGATPNRIIKVFGHPAEGSTTLAGGRCQGTTFGLAGLRLLEAFNADANGDASVVRKTKAAHCGIFLQALDVGSCATSEVTNIP